MNSDVQVLGQLMIDSIHAIGHRAQPILKRYGVQNPQADAWYPQRSWLNVLRTLSGEAILDLMAVGNRIADTFRMPEGAYTLPNALHAVDQSYRQNHRNADNIGLCAEFLSDNTLRIVDRSPYPQELQYGVIYGLLSKFMPLGANLTLSHASEESRPGESIYIAAW